MKKEPLDLSEKEIDLVRQVAKKEGLTDDEAATQLVQKEMARRVKRRTGKVPAKVYQMRRK